MIRIVTDKGEAVLLNRRAISEVNKDMQGRCVITMTNGHKYTMPPTTDAHAMGFCNQGHCGDV